MCPYNKNIVSNKTRGPQKLTSTKYLEIGYLDVCKNFAVLVKLRKFLDKIKKVTKILLKLKSSKKLKTMFLNSLKLSKLHKKYKEQSGFRSAQAFLSDILT